MNSDSKTEEKPQPLRKRFREETAEAILAAAERVFAEQGLHTARMDDIALAAGVSVGTLYNYFADREALFTKLLELRRADLVKRLDDVPAGVEGTPFESELESLLGVIFEHFDKHRRFLSIALAGEHVPSTRGTAPSSRETMRAIYPRFEQVVARGLSAGSLSLESSALYPALLMGMARGVLMRSLYDESLGSMAPHAREVVRLFLTGARRRS
jgi:AcrR family transcriptional regulator